MKIPVFLPFFGYIDSVSRVMNGCNYFQRKPVFVYKKGTTSSNTGYCALFLKDQLAKT